MNLPFPHAYGDFSHKHGEYAPTSMGKIPHANKNVGNFLQEK